ncbi:DUF1835 domain-containing protein [Salegentibacter chungangensis]|uniref:DUF1835 domain-containing protein n=1 Tax=Salegentibacter chungangensis TaxID=1335724 RepID=A0ABW3NSC6_9FLAO
MENKALHIVNGDDLAGKMKDLDLSGQVIVWRELLCEGPCLQEVGSREFIKTRKKFLKCTYGISSENYEEKFVSELSKLKKAGNYDHIILWFEFDLFCHINMLAAISFITENKYAVPMYLVCSKKLQDEEELQPLSRLSQKQLLNHFENKISLNTDDIEMANLIWELYCSNNPMQLKQQIKKTSNFEYLSSSIRAHIERFPNSVTGINSLERNVLKLIEKHKIASQNQLLGYALQYQGYYGYSDTQMQRLLEKMNAFYVQKGDVVRLTEKGEQALAGTKNFYRELKNDDYFGGAAMYAFLYDSESHRLLKL